MRYTRQTEGQNNDNPPSRKPPLREKYWPLYAGVNIFHVYHVGFSITGEDEVDVEVDGEVDGKDGG